jgi:hypothetical protein
LLIGEYTVPKKVFPNLEQHFSYFKSKEFSELPDRIKSEKVNEKLFELIEQEKTPCFLLSAVLDYIGKIDEENILHHYAFNSFELWLNQYAGISYEKNLETRAKIAGKWVPREEYQRFFPIGMNKSYEGSHFVTAHKSPDLDTTIASFWGWLDAFSAKVGTALHMWNVPGGPPSSQIEIQLLFKEMFSPYIFTHLAKTRTTLSLTGNDLMTQLDLITKNPHDRIVSGLHETAGQAVVITDDQGYYLGDWRSLDVEKVRLMIMLLNNCLRWFENQVHIRLFSLFSQKQLKEEDLSSFIQSLFSLKLAECEPAKEYSDKDKEHLELFLTKVLKVSQGLDCTFEEFGIALSKLSLVDFAKVQNIVSAIKDAGLFDEKGLITENRAALFAYLEKTIRGLHQALHTIRTYIERFDVALQIKDQVFGESHKFVSVRADVEEIRSKMDNLSFLTVTYPDKNKFYPVGVISSTAIRKPILGTVSLRDFCNREEMSIPSYLDVISVIDHHKTALQTTQPPLAVIQDAQSSNSIVGTLSMQINDYYSTYGLNESDIEQLLQSSDNDPRCQARLMEKKKILQRKDHFFIHPDREIAEYIHFIYGILDDTDLLTKVSDYDIDSLSKMLSRLKSLVEQKEVQFISLDDIPRGENFAKTAAQKILQTEDMYSIYKKVYQYKEEKLEENIKLASKHKENTLFADTKEQNGCCRVGQTKLFAKNFPLFQKQINAIRKEWVAVSENRYKEHPEIDLYMHMVSTIVSAAEVFKGDRSGYDHKDQIWIWVPDSDLALEHLKRFLTAFQEAPHAKDISLSVSFSGKDTKVLEEIFAETFPELPREETEEGQGENIAILHFNAGALNSRKSHISPYLPKLMS